MPLAGSGTVLGAAVATATLPGDAAAAAAWSGAATPLVAFLVANAKVIPGAMVAAGTAVSGLGLLTVTGDTDELGVAMANGAGAGASGVAQWTAIAKAIVDFVKSNGQVSPVAFAAVASGGAVSGTGKLQFASSALGPLLQNAAGANDAAAPAAFASIANAILTHLATVTVVLPTPLGMASPSGGGALTGSGTLS